MRQVSEKETKEILRVAEDCLTSKGDFVELGCFEGDTSLLIAELLKDNSSEKELWIYDSFEGLPEKTKEDFSEIGKDFKKGELFVTKKYVKQRFLRANLKVPKIKKAWFSDLGSSDLPEKIAFAFLDGDLYDSIRVSLNLVAPRLDRDGKMVVHDYQNAKLPGVEKAVDEFIKKEGWDIEFRVGIAILSKKS